VSPRPVIVPRGVRQHVLTAQLANRLERADKPGQHLWTILGVWMVTNPAQRENVELDAENLLTVEGPGCFKCELPYNVQTARKPCRGSL
jgi:hypothetical protein